MMPKAGPDKVFTVVIPARNAEVFIEETLHSLAVQTLREFVAYIIDDGSTDLTASVVQAFINNSGDAKYILSYDSQGTMHTDNVSFIGALQGSAFQPVSLSDAITHNFHLKMSNWYYFHSDPFLTLRNHLVYMNYSDNGLTCTYLWKGSTMSLINTQQSNCYSRKQEESQ